SEGSSCRQNAAIGQEQGNGVIASIYAQARHRCPGTARRIPHLACACWIARVRVRTFVSSGATTHQNFAIRKQGRGVKSASSRHHRLSVIPSGRGTIQVNYLGGCRWKGGATGIVKPTWASTHEQYFAV